MVSPANLFKCWKQFRKGKHKKIDIQTFERHLEDYIFQLQEELASLQYRHGLYHFFYVFEPKERYIGKASVRDRLVHEMLHATLTDVFDRHFIFHSLSSSLCKGIHMGVEHLQRMIRKVSGNGTKPCFALKMDIRKFFDSIQHVILKKLIRQKIFDERVLKLIDMVIDTFPTKTPGVGIPLGNVTSQLFANIYLHTLDNFVKRDLHLRYYLRYCDDFIFLSNSAGFLIELIPRIRNFLKQNLGLELHPKKVIIRKLSQGIDFVGYLFFSKHRLLRVQTKKRMKKRLKQGYVDYVQGNMEAKALDQRLQSYLGILSHANQQSLSQSLKNAYWIRSSER